jgi:Family of unknown function (DUF5343)
MIMSELPKAATPAYTTASSFNNLINDLRETGIPTHITRSVMKGSNSGKATMASSLKALGLINEDTTPTNKLVKLVKEPANYKANLASVIQDAYPFLFDGSIDLVNTTSEKVAEKFKTAGASGSTVSKGVAFFLAIAKDAAVEVSARVKAPTPARPANGQKPKSRKPNDEAENDDEDDPVETEETHEGMIKIPIPLHGLGDGAIYLPDGMTKKQWEYAKKMASFILENYQLSEEDEKS